MATPDSKSFAILGAGATGLAAAHRLTRLGHGVRVFEASSRVGGAIRTELTGGWLIESGPNSLLSGEPALAPLIDELGLASERIAANPAAKKRFIVRRGRLLPAPLSPPGFIASPLFSAPAKLRVLLELFTRPRVRTTDVSLDEFVASHFGREFADYALNPFVSGVYAGKPEKLSTRYSFPKLWELERTRGSLIRGQLAAAKARRARGEPHSEIFSFRRGLQTLTDALAASLPAGAIAFDVTLDAIVPSDGAATSPDTPDHPGEAGPPRTAPRPPHRTAGPSASRRWNIVWHDAAGTHTQAFDAVLSALPAPALAQLRIGPHGERPLAALAAMEHPPVSSLFLGYRREQIPHPLDGFGGLVPALEQRSVLGILFSSTLFPGRAPDGHAALTVMVGGARQPELAALPTEKLLAIVRRDLADLVGASGDPVFIRHTFWPRAIPQYNLGYEQHLAAITSAERDHPGLLIGGQCRDGISVPACLAAGETLAARATA